MSRSGEWPGSIVSRSNIFIVKWLARCNGKLDITSLHPLALGGRHRDEARSPSVLEHQNCSFLAYSSYIKNANYDICRYLLTDSDFRVHVGRMAPLSESSGLYRQVRRRPHSGSALSGVEIDARDGPGSDDDDKNPGNSPFNPTPTPAIAVITVTETRWSLPAPLPTVSNLSALSTADSSSVGGLSQTSNPPSPSSTASSGSTATMSQAHDHVPNPLSELHPVLLSSGAVVAVVLGGCFIIAIILICLFAKKFARNRMFTSGRPWKRIRPHSTGPEPTISSFEPKEYAGSTFYVFPNSTRSLRSLVTLPSFLISKSRPQTPVGAVPHTPRIIPPVPALPAPYHDNMISRQKLSASNGSHVAIIPTTGIAIFPDGFQFEAVQSADNAQETDGWPRTVNTTTSFPTSLHDTSEFACRPQAPSPPGLHMDKSPSFCRGAYELTDAVCRNSIWERRSSSRGLERQREMPSSRRTSGSVDNRLSYRLDSPLPPVPSVSNHIQWLYEGPKGKSSEDRPSSKLCRERIKDSTSSAAIHTAPLIAKVKQSSQGKLHLPLAIGDFVRVLAEYEDGSAFCVDSRGKKGMVPVGCLERDDDEVIDRRTFF
ncbi:hypothetical protein B0H34DRAFT_672598 [Crassisporium funariophilum]|nr:hypothetical protein B0H34DRAFT_672598 [Crassisporium funariophilum]